MHFTRSISSVAIALSCASCTMQYHPNLYSASSVSRAAAPVLSVSAPVLHRASVAPEVPVREAPTAISRADMALAVIERRVVQQSHPEALRLAFQAYHNFREAHPEQVRNPYLYFVDYGLDSREPRGYVFDMDRLEVIDGPFTVAHGRGSLRTQEGVPTRFSNVQNSATTSLGLFLAQETYAFSGKSNGARYRSIGLRLRGLSGTYNNAARRRGIVVHGAPYVTPDKAGRSEGCPAMEESRAQRLIPMIANGGVVFLFSSRDTNWMKNDPWISGGGGRVAATGAGPSAG